MKGFLKPKLILLLATVMLLVIAIVGPLAGGNFLARAQGPASVSFARETKSIENPIQEENALPGTTSWQLTNPANYDEINYRYPEIEGYAWITTAKAGDTVKFSVSTEAPSFKAELYRLGWYQGLGANLKETITNITGHFYAMPTMDQSTGLVSANWPPSFSIRVSSRWTTGQYVVKLTASTGGQGYIPFVIRSTRPSDFVFVHAIATDNAYNDWGGASLYSDFTGKLAAGRAYKVSFDRPFHQNYGYYGAGQVFDWEYPMLRWIEKNGYNVSYISDLDVNDNPTFYQGKKGILLVGHSEYWSKAMRSNLETGVSKGVNLANFAANSIFWQVRFEPRPTNPFILNRVMTCYKDYTVDPLYGVDNTNVTVQFRDAPLNNPEQSLLGSMFSNLNGISFPWVVADESNWIFAGTGLHNGDSLPGLVGYESDKVFADYPQPNGLSIISASPVINNHNQQQDVSNATVYTASSGAEVVNMATMQWSWGLDNSSVIESNNVVHPAAQQITANILQYFLTHGTTI
jgi:hypothetical protein